MTKAYGFSEGCKASVKQRSMNIAVCNDDVAFLGNAGECSQIRLKTCAKDQRRLAFHKLCKLFFKLKMQSHCAVKHTRAGTTSTIFIYSLSGSLLDFLVGGQAQIIVRPEH